MWTDRRTDGQTDVGHINLIGGLVTRNPPKKSVPMSINDFVDMTISLCLIGFSIYAKMQGFVDIYIFCYFIFTQKFKMAETNGRKMIFGKSR